MVRQKPASVPPALLRQYGSPRATLLHCGARSTVWRLDATPPLVVKLCREAGAAAREYCVLGVFADRFGKDPRIRVIRPVALDADRNAVITEYLSFMTLRELGSVQHRVRRLGRAAASFEDLLHRAGIWLRILHDDSSLRDALSGLTRTTPRSSRPYPQLLDAARQAGMPPTLVQDAGAAMATTSPLDTADPVGITHGDFGTSNIACSGSALALVDLGDVALEPTVHEIARTCTRLLAMPSLATRRSIESARSYLMDAYGGYPESSTWRYWRIWALLELYAELVPAGWKRTLVTTATRRRCIRDLRDVLD
jgi:hypothetical protein